MKKKLGLILFFVMLASFALAANHDLRTGGSTALQGRGLQVISKTIDFTADSLSTGDTIQALTIPARTLVYAVTAECVKAEGSASTFQVGDSVSTTGYISSFNANVASGISTSAAGLGQCNSLAFNFYDSDVAASQSAAEWGTQAGAGVGGTDTKEVPLPFGGSIVGISVYSNAAATSGTLTADATIDGTVTGLQAGLNSVDDEQTSYTSQAAGTDLVTPGQRVGVKVTTSSVWAPTTADATVTVIVKSDEGAAGPYSGGKYYAAADYILLKTPTYDASHGKIKITIAAMQF